MPPLLEVRDLQMSYEVRRYWRPVGAVHALGGVSFDLQAGETVAIVGESGCGKTTLARCLLGIDQPTGGSFYIDGKSPGEMAPAERRRAVQMIFQDPYGSLNPRQRSWQIIAEPLAINTRMREDERRQRAVEMMRKVGLRPELADRYPHMLSGGQRQRLGIARALVLQPRLLVCDEPVSALDVSIQAQILNLLMDLQDDLGLAYLFISHDLSVVRHIADRVLVIYLGKTVEYGTREEIFTRPKHPYTRSLLESTPRIDLRGGARRAAAPAIRGELPSPMNPPPGCSFHRRCPRATERCSRETPVLREVSETLVACHLDDADLLA